MWSRSSAFVFVLLVYLVCFEYRISHTELWFAGGAFPASEKAVDNMYNSVCTCNISIRKVDVVHREIVALLAKS